MIIGQFNSRTLDLSRRWTAIAYYQAPRIRVMATPPSTDNIVRMIPYRARGLSDLEQRVGGVIAEIDEAISRKGRARILEVGCGYGTALLQLASQYGTKLEIHGVNRKAGDGDDAIIAWNAERIGLPHTGKPTIHIIDANQRLPFARNYFDVVFSQVTWLYIEEKLLFISEVGRIIARSGIGKIQIGDVDSGDPRKCWIEIWRRGRRITFQEFAELTPGLTFIADGGNSHLIVEKPATVTYGDELLLTVPLSRLNPEWVGFRSLYCQEPLTLSPDREWVSIELSPAHREGYCYEAKIARIPEIETFALEEDGSSRAMQQSCYDDIRDLGQGRWCVKDSRFGYSVFLSSRDSRAEANVAGRCFRLIRPIPPDLGDEN